MSNWPGTFSPPSRRCLARNQPCKRPIQSSFGSTCSRGCCNTCCYGSLPCQPSKAFQSRANGTRLGWPALAVSSRPDKSRNQTAKLSTRGKRQIRSSSASRNEVAPCMSHLGCREWSSTQSSSASSGISWPKQWSAPNLHRPRGNWACLCRQCSSRAHCTQAQCPRSLSPCAGAHRKPGAAPGPQVQQAWCFQRVSCRPVTHPRSPHHPTQRTCSGAIQGPESSSWRQLP
mmetsp:Transcript_96892/g.269526  ORF Transcript_96892/g.269526 Transcript_96892/m.269526 type:complete len:230 (+) Transcript_96892:421-1110(+)